MPRALRGARARSTITAFFGSAGSISPCAVPVMRSYAPTLPKLMPPKAVAGASSAMVVIRAAASGEATIAERIVRRKRGTATRTPDAERAGMEGSPRGIRGLVLVSRYGTTCRHAFRDRRCAARNRVSRRAAGEGPKRLAYHSVHRMERRMNIAQLLDIELPIIQAPMAGVQAGALAAAVSGAGALGSLPCALLTPEAMTKELALIRS